METVVMAVSMLTGCGSNKTTDSVSTDEFDLPDGAGLLVAIIVRAIMIFHFIIKMSAAALDAVPK